MIKRPMLAAKWEEDMDLRYPTLTSPKLDGLRILCHPELGPITRSFKPLPNDYARKVLSSPRFHGFDGELMLADPDLNFNAVQSAFMRKDGEPYLDYFVFDSFRHPWEPWKNRVQDLANTNDSFITVVEHAEANKLEDILAQEVLALKLGFEGIMLRDPEGVYKFGRSTPREQGLMKLKRHKDAEGQVVNLIEQLHNDNEQTRDRFGLAERSSHKANMTPAGCLGKIVVQTSQWGEVTIGTGFTLAERHDIWRNPGNYMGRWATFKYQEVLKDKPRFPVFLNWRVD